MSSSFSRFDDGDIICADDAAGSPDVTLNLEAGDLEEGQIGSVGSAGALPEGLVVVAPGPQPDFKAKTMQRLQKLERRGVTVGTHLDELRSVLSSLVERMPD